jgi:flagellar motor switch protein FliN/FliY
MSLDKLLKLKPGNILQLGVQVEKGVNLVANGECVGKGELVQIGDVIGVKITQLGE